MMATEIVLKAAQEFASSVKIAKSSDRVYKSECMFCFESPLSPAGLFINLRSYQCFCERHIELDQRRTGSLLYLRIKQTKIPKEEEACPVPTKLAFGVTGGFNAQDQQEEISTEYYLTVTDGTSVTAELQLPDDRLPSSVLEAIKALQEHSDVNLQADEAAWQEERLVSKYAENLPQLPRTRKISPNPKEWRCDETGVNDNLWLNLSTGFIGSGRPHWDGTGGNGAALRHFEATGKQYPLVVKLGTITPTGADVFSYADDENDMVLDPYLEKHLAHWGINMLQMEKTEKTITELQIDRNMSYEFNKITEGGLDLEPITGQGYVGLKNLGNTCYMNSVVQLLWTIPDLQRKFVEPAQKLFEMASDNPSEDLVCQLAKLGCALAGPHEPDGPSSISPSAFKRVVGRSHPEFSSLRQQDAQEYFSYLIESIDRALHAARTKISDAGKMKSLFGFGLETRIECLTSHRVSYALENPLLLSLEIPMEAAVNVVEVDGQEQKRQKTDTDQEVDKYLPLVPLSACLEKFVAEEQIDDYYSAYLAKTSVATKTVRLKSFPPFLIIHLRRYYVDSNWTPKKLEVLVDMPDRLSLGSLKAVSHEGELLQPERDAPEKAVDEALLSQMTSMGFSEADCKRAFLATGAQDVVTAMEWLLSNGSGENDGQKEENIATLESMGFNSIQAEKALINCDGNVERAIEWLFNNPDIADEDDAEEISSLTLFNGEYELVGFISHMGANTACGHYVCHVKKNGMWTIFNDEKVALSKDPPLRLGYMYLYQRIDEKEIKT